MEVVMKFFLMASFFLINSVLLGQDIEITSQNNECLQIKEYESSFFQSNIIFFNNCPWRTATALCIVHKDGKTEIIQKSRLEENRPWSVYLRSSPKNPILKVIVASKPGVATVPSACESHNKR
jgi:hypothetical protein